MLNALINSGVYNHTDVIVFLILIKVLNNP